MKCNHCNGTGKQCGEPHYRCEDCEGTGKVLCDECFEELEFCQCYDTNNEPKTNDEDES